MKLKDVGSVFELIRAASQIGPLAQELLKYDDPNDADDKPELVQIREEMEQARALLESVRSRAQVLLIKAGKSAQEKGLI